MSAISEPDTVTVSHRPWDKEAEWSVKDRSLGSKKVKIVIDESSKYFCDMQCFCVFTSQLILVADETREEELDSTSASKLCLSDDLAIRLAQLAKEREERFGGPRDVEFAVKDVSEIITFFFLGLRDVFSFQDQIFLLQSRPVTSFLSWTDDELYHEFDTGSHGQSEVLSKGNVG